MTLDLSHLASSVKEEAFHDAPTRIRFVQTARWVEFARGRLALEELERRYHYPSCARMPCMLLYGTDGSYGSRRGTPSAVFTEYRCCRDGVP